MQIQEYTKELLMIEVRELLKQNGLFITNEQYNISISEDNKTIAVICNTGKNAANGFPVDLISTVTLLLLQKDSKGNISHSIKRMPQYKNIKVDVFTPIILSKDSKRLVLSLPVLNVVHVYDIITYTRLFLRGVLTSKDISLNDLYGFSIGINDDASIVVIGAPKTRIENSDRGGIVYIFKLNEEGQEYKELRRLVTPIQNTDQYLGIKIVGGDRILDAGVWVTLFQIYSELYTYSIYFDDDADLIIKDKKYPNLINL